ncbi:hypothetical protein SBF1_7020003 [Candidatus Desulfosporosinus infrequens]|uniref:Uncharacterized protein n=1 Tax=Candidatus Desulfosporosinus infrequens TaxID=2043169 RepID=A0A2U3LPT8_9FIRM|nr:hypothetical protein SBF1_7020003 [Candidatus Desulfosporosinus infrequens]
MPYDTPAIQYGVCQGVNEFVLQKTDGATDFPAVPSVNQDIRNFQSTKCAKLSSSQVLRIC